MNLYGTDDYWEERRAAIVRAQRARRIREFADAIWNAALAIAAIVLIVVACRTVARRDVEERAAYLQGRWGLDRATALRFAEAEREAKAKGEGEGEQVEVGG